MLFFQYLFNANKSSYLLTPYEIIHFYTKIYELMKKYIAFNTKRKNRLEMLSHSNIYRIFTHILKLEIVDWISLFLIIINFVTLKLLHARVSHVTFTLCWCKSNWLYVLRWICILYFERANVLHFVNSAYKLTVRMYVFVSINSF